MKKIRITALLLTLVMVAGALAACAAPAATGDTPAPAAAGGSAPEYVTIGFLSPYHRR